MSTCNRLDWHTLGSQPVIMPKKSLRPLVGISARRFWGIYIYRESVKIRMILNPTGYMLTSSGFAFIRLRYIPYIPLK